MRRRSFLMPFSAGVDLGQGALQVVRHADFGEEVAIAGVHRVASHRLAAQERPGPACYSVFSHENLEIPAFVTHPLFGTRPGKDLLNSIELTRE